jgi:hypothetical protein
MQIRYLVFASLLFLGIPATAQQLRFDNTLVLTTSGGLGYANPGFVYRAGVEVEGTRAVIRASGGFGSARKLETGDGWVRRFRADSYFKVRKLLIGGGISGSKLTTSRWSKGSVHPLIGAGIQNSRARAIVAYMLPGTDDQNGVRGVDVQLRLQISKRVAFNPEISMLRYYSTGRPDLPRKFGIAAGIGFTYSFGHTGFDGPPR